MYPDISYISDRFKLSTDNPTKEFSSAISKSIQHYGGKRSQRIEDSITSLVGVMVDQKSTAKDDKAARLPREFIVKQARKNNPRLFAISDADLYDELATYSSKNNTERVFEEYAYSKDKRLYGLVNDFTEKYEYARLKLTRSFNKWDSSSDVKLVTNPENLMLMNRHPELIKLLVSHLHRLTPLDSDPSKTKRIFLLYFLHVFQQKLENQSERAYSDHLAILRTPSYPFFERFSKLLVAYCAEYQAEKLKENKYS